MALLALLGAVLATTATEQQAQAFPAEQFCNNNQPPSDASYEGYLDAEDVGEALAHVEQSSQGNVDVDVAGFSNQGRPIWTARLGEGETVVLVQSQIHGNERHGTTALLNLIRTLGNNSARSKEIREAITLVAIPNLNMDGGEIPRRQNVMAWDDIVALHPQLAGVPANPGAWYHSTNAGGMDLNRDFHPDLDYEPVAADLPGNSASVGFYLSPESRTVRDVYRSLENEFGTVDVFVDLHGQAVCYGHGFSSELVIDGPSSAAGGTYHVTHATFGPPVTPEGFSGEIVLVDDGSANPTLGCQPLTGFPEGAIALMDRGECSFVQKVTNAQNAGAVAAIIANDRRDTPIALSGSGPDITIPSGMVSVDNGRRIKDGLPATGTLLDNPDSDFYTPLSISGRFIEDPAGHGDWPNFDDEASRRINVAVYDALNQRGNSPYGKVTLYPQGTNLPGTALGSFALRGSAVILFETGGQTQQLGPKQIGMRAKQVEVGLGGIFDAITDGTLDNIDAERYFDIPERVNSPVE
jgi:hypothetical protein